jgi:hypothetical protein
MVDVETILASLYAKEISASLEWKSDRGFYPGFGYPGNAREVVPDEWRGCPLIRN